MSNQEPERAYSAGCYNEDLVFKVLKQHWPQCRWKDNTEEYIKAAFDFSCWRPDYLEEIRIELRCSSSFRLKYIKSKDRNIEEGIFINKRKVDFMNQNNRPGMIWSFLTYCDGHGLWYVRITPDNISLEAEKVMRDPKFEAHGVPCPAFQLYNLTNIMSEAVFNNLLYKTTGVKKIKV